MAVGALLRRRWIVERPRALARDAGRLPVVVVVEAAEPAIVVHRHVEVHLVADRAELRRLLAVERLEERVPVRLGREVQQRVVRPPQQGALAGGQIVERRVLDGEVALTHRAVHVRDRMAGGACQTRLRLGRIDLLLDRAIEAAVEEHRVVVAARAPFRRPRPDHVLHVLDRLAIPLVVERREMVHRRAPLFVDVAVAAGAALARHEERRRDDAVDVRVGGGRRRRRVHDAIGDPPPGLAASTNDRCSGRRHEHRRHRGADEPRPAREDEARGAEARRRPPEVEDEEQAAERGCCHVGVDQQPVGCRGAEDEDRAAEDHASARNSEARKPKAPKPKARNPERPAARAPSVRERQPGDPGRQCQAQQRMHGDLHEIPERRIRKCPEVRRVQEQCEIACKEETRRDRARWHARQFHRGDGATTTGLPNFAGSIGTFGWTSVSV